MSAELRLEGVDESRLETLVELDRRCFETPWPASSWAGELGAAHTQQFVGLQERGGLVAYASVSLVAGEAEIRRIAVLPEHRRRGHGREFLVALLGRLRAAGAERVYLEVRASNRAARALYAAAGFAEDRIRAGYYRAPLEDGVDLSRSL